MFDKKKRNFWVLALTFMLMTVIVLVSFWGAPQTPKATTMDSSMGNMMKSMHLSGIKIYDLFRQHDGQNENEAANHHSGQASVIFKLNFLSTAVIFILLPFLIGGSILLTIVWIR